jgi:hypothetical protein
MRVNHVLLPVEACEIDRVRVVQIVTNLDPEVRFVAAVAERVGVDDPAVNGFDVVSDTSARLLVERRFEGDLRATASPLRFVSMRDLQVKRLRGEDRWRQS